MQACGLPECLGMQNALHFVEVKRKSYFIGTPYVAALREGPHFLPLELLVSWVSCTSFWSQNKCFVLRKMFKEESWPLRPSDGELATSSAGYWDHE